MKNQNQFKGKNILVVGIAKSGEAVSRLLHRLGADITVNDAKPYEQNEQAKELETLGIRVICGAHPLSLLDEPIDFIVKNPGIPYSNPLISEAEKRGISIITEIEIASKIAEADIIAITGSNGKTTTTTLIVEMLKESRFEPLVAGNIGTVACEVAEKATKKNVIVMEVSSFQLQGTETFHPKIAILLNLSDAHLDYHGTKEAYVHAKGKIYSNLSEEDYAIVNLDSMEVVTTSEKTRAKKVLFSVSKQLEQGVFVKNHDIYYNNEKVVSTTDIALPGKHNLENILAAVAAAKLMGASNQRIRQVLQTFTGVKHRLQYVATINERKFYNNSKATNITAAQTAVHAFEEPIVLLAGGLDRGNSFDDFIPALKKVKAIVTFGQTEEKLIEAAKKAGVETILRADNVESAVPLAYESSAKGDIILLSPACASWDQYKTFEERGDKFIEAVCTLNK